MPDFYEIADNLSEVEPGIWSSGSTAACSYPEDGQQVCFGLEDNSFWFRHRNNAVITAVKKFPPEGFILDVGGSNGYVTLGLKKSGFDVVLLEPGIEGLQNAKVRGLEPIICSTVADAGFKDHSIPAIGLFDVLEHIKDETRFLKGLKRILVPNGRLYLTVPAYNALWSMEDEYAEHFRRYTLSRIRKTLQICGYTTDYATCLFSYLPIPVFFVRTLPFKLGLAKLYSGEDHRRQHAVKSRLINSILSVLHKMELAMIEKEMRIPLGGSLLIIAHTEKGYE